MISYSRKYRNNLISLWQFTIAIMDIYNINEIEFANKMGWSKEVMNDYVEGELTEEMLANLEKEFGIDKAVWERINRDYLGKD